jgi:hypothetical protein
VGNLEKGDALRQRAREWEGGREGAREGREGERGLR